MAIDFGAQLSTALTTSIRETFPASPGRRPGLHLRGSMYFVHIIKTIHKYHGMSFSCCAPGFVTHVWNAFSHQSHASPARRTQVLLSPGVLKMETLRSSVISDRHDDHRARSWGAWNLVPVPVFPNTLHHDEKGGTKAKCLGKKKVLPCLEQEGSTGTK